MEHLAWVLVWAVVDTEGTPMKARIIVWSAVVAAMAVSPAFAAGKKKPMKRAAQQETSRPVGPVASGARTAGAVAGGAAATAGAIATAPFNPTLVGPVSTLNGPSCKMGETVTINGQKMRCQ
jgi:hypothetical protein